MKIDGTGIPPASRAGKPEKPPRGRSSGAAPESTDIPADGADGVDLSALSQALAVLAATNDIREDLVETILAQLASGEYLDGDKLREAVLRMLSE